MRSTKWNSEIRQLFRDTQVRYPHQQLEADTQKAYLEDWRDECDRVGFARFSEGVKNARVCSEFFPMIAKIRKFVPEPKQDGAAIRRELAALHRRREQGEKFYTLADVILELCNRVESGQVKGRDEAGQKKLQEWVKNLRGSEKRYAAKMLADEAEYMRGKSDFQEVHEILDANKPEVEAEVVLAIEPADLDFDKNAETLRQQAERLRGEVK